MAVCARSAGKDEERQPFAGAAGAWCRRKRLVWARPSIKVSENAGAGYGRKSCRGTGQRGFRILRDESDLSAKLGNQHFLDVAKPRRSAQV
jgi:hypothetical protein